MNYFTRGLGFIYACKYPQGLFGLSVQKEVSKSLNKLSYIIDIPCGIGETSFLIALSARTTVEAFDISDSYIKKALKRFKLSNLFFSVADISTILGYGRKKADFICIINSLFLLPNPKEVLISARNSLTADGKLIIIVPNIHSKNFEQFQKGSNDNLFSLDILELFSLAKQAGFSIDSSSGLGHVNYYTFRILAKIPIISHLTFHALNFIKFSKTPTYYILNLSLS